MLNSLPSFSTGRSFPAEVTMEKLNALSKAAGRGVAAVNGNIRMTDGPQGLTLYVPPPVNPNRASVVYGTSSTGLPGSFPLATLTSDVDTTNAAYSVLVSVAGNAIAFRFEGTYLVHYHGTVALDIGGSNDHTPGVVEATAELKAGGTALPGSSSVYSAAQIVNLSDFIYSDDGLAPDITVDVGGATGTADTLGIVTLDNPQVIDATDNLDKIADYSITATVKGTLSGTALFEVINDAGTLKIRAGGVNYTNSLIVDGGVTGGDADALTCAVSIFKIF